MDVHHQLYHDRLPGSHRPSDDPRLPRPTKVSAAKAHADLSPLAFWLTASDRRIAQARLARFRRVDINPINLKTFWRTVKNPALYMIIYIYVGMLIGVSGINYFQLWLKSLKNADGTPRWGVSQLNAIPMGGYAMQMAGIWATAIASDYFKTRWLVLIAICLIGIPSCIIMTVWDVPIGAKYYACKLTGCLCFTPILTADFILYICQSHGPPLWAWVSDMLPTDAEQRALTIGMSITGYYAINAWSNVLIFPASQAPHYKYGWPVCLAMWITSGVVVVALRMYDVKVIRPRNHLRALEAMEDEGAFDDAGHKSDEQEGATQKVSSDSHREIPEESTAPTLLR